MTARPTKNDDKTLLLDVEALSLEIEGQVLLDHI